MILDDAPVIPDLALHLRASVPVLRPERRGQRPRRSVHPLPEDLARAAPLTSGQLTRPTFVSLRTQAPDRHDRDRRACSWSRSSVVVEQRQRTAIIEEVARRGTAARARAWPRSRPAPCCSTTSPRSSRTPCASRHETDVPYALILDRRGGRGAQPGPGARGPDAVGRGVAPRARGRAGAPGDVRPARERRSTTSRCPSWSRASAGGPCGSACPRHGWTRRSPRPGASWPVSPSSPWCWAAWPPRSCARRIARPVRQLADGVAAIARGELDQRIEPGRSDEIGRLALAFNDMAAQLGRQRAELEAAHAELRQRFAELSDLKSYTDHILGSLRQRHRDPRPRRPGGHPEPGRRGAHGRARPAP